MPGDCLSRREELARLQESPILRMGPKLETQAPSVVFAALPRGRDPVSSARAFPKSLIYNISLMAGQTRGYELWDWDGMKLRGRAGTPARCWRHQRASPHKCGTLRAVRTRDADANGKVSLVQAGGIRCLPSDGNMRHRPRTDRTSQTGKTMSHARPRAALRKIASVSLRDERENATAGGALAGNFRA
jgi:hypothetical protein